MSKSKGKPKVAIRTSRSKYDSDKHGSTYSRKGTLFGKEYESRRSADGTKITANRSANGSTKFKKTNADGDVGRQTDKKGVISSPVKRSRRK